MTHLVTGLCVVIILVSLYVLPVLMWDVLTLEPETPED